MFGDGTIVMFDPNPTLDTKLAKIRPKHPLVIQLEMAAIGAYSMYLFSPKDETLREFEDADALRANLWSVVLDRYYSGKLPEVNEELFMGRLMDQALALMSNFRIANLDLRHRVAYKVIPKPENYEKKEPWHLNGDEGKLEPVF